jgi:ribosomal protection tetracycline resistance protein
MPTLNLGILAHVDAGKTTLTERLLHAVGVIDEIGSVDDGTTQTDSLALERQRGITIKSAVVSFLIDDVTVNLIDTPGHPDFIAEVERVLSVLDGAVLIVSAVEGVQAQTRVLMRALQRLRVPTLFFVNKIDRAGAGYERVLTSISQKLTSAVWPLGVVNHLGTRAAEFVPSGSLDAAGISRLVGLLADHNDALMAAYVEDETAISWRDLRNELATQTKQALVHPVFFGSALTGAGLDSLIGGIPELLPTVVGNGDGPVAGTVFKIERGPAGEKVAYVRMFSGTVRTRDRLRFGQDRQGKVTAISVFARGSADRRGSVTAGHIAKLWGLREVRIGHTIGALRQTSTGRHFAPPTLETVVVPTRPTDRGSLQVALDQLADQDPLINVRRDHLGQELSVSLYGEVQKEVIQATLATEFGVDVTFRDSTPICIERPIGSGEAIEVLHAESNPFHATIGLRVEPAPVGAGIDFQLGVDPRTLPLHIYKTAESFRETMAQHVRQALQEGIWGWQVTDCLVTMTRCMYSIADGPPSRRGPPSTPADFRKLTPIVLMGALEQAGTVVCEPLHRFHLTVPDDTLGAILPALTRLRAVPQTPVMRYSSYLVEGEIPAAQVHELTQQLPALTRGEGILESVFDRYQPVRGAIPTRPRSVHHPLNRMEYLQYVSGRVAGLHDGR